MSKYEGVPLGAVDEVDCPACGERTIHRLVESHERFALVVRKWQCGKCGNLRD